MLVNFDAFNRLSIPRMKNAVADLLATSVATIVPTNNRCSIELLFSPGIPYNIMNLRVFNDDLQILEFLTNDENCKGAVIVEE